MNSPVRLGLAAAIATGVVLAGCAGDQDPGLQPAPEQPTTEHSAPEQPTAGQPTQRPSSTPALEWSPVDAPAGSTVTANSGWRVTVDEERAQAVLDGPFPSRVAGDKRFRIEHVLLDERWAIVVRGDSLRQRAAEATVVDLSTGESEVLDGRADPPTVSGGTWALHGDVVVHATRGPDGRYCLARRDLATGASEITYCVEDRHGFTNARVTDAGVGLMSFDDSRPSCRTVGVVDGPGLAAQPGVPDCTGWELVATGAGTIWSVIPKESELDTSHVYAAPATSSDSEPVDLGPAAAGSLVPCGDAAYFTRDSTRDSPAQVLRWTGADTVDVVLETDEGNAFIQAPRCGGDRLTVSVFAESGDQQLSAPVP